MPSQFKKKVRGIVFEIFLWSLPLVLIAGEFFNGFPLADKERPPFDAEFFGQSPVVHQTGASPIEMFSYLYLIFIAGLVIYGFRYDKKMVRYLCVKELGLWLFVIWSVGSGCAIGLGFAIAVYPQDDYLRQHCHLVRFIQDGKPFRVGLCDLVFVDSSGQTDFSLIYDESGDIRNDETLKETNHTPDRREWVNAVREIVHNDPNQLFEISSFFSDQVYGDFYTVGFSNSNDSGFTREYGPPPTDPKNLFKPAF